MAIRQVFAHEEITAILAEAFVARYRKMEERGATIRLPIPAGPATRWHAQIASVEGRRVFTMARADWGRFRAREGHLIEIDLERTPADDLAERASAIAALAARCHVETERIEVWRYVEDDPPGLSIPLLQTPPLVIHTAQLRSS